MPYVLGYGSLLHPDSLRRTLPRIVSSDLQPVYVKGFKRVFNLVSPGWSAALDGPIAGREVAALNVVADPGQSFNAVAFGVEEEALPALNRREFCYYQVRGVPFYDFATGRPIGRGMLYSVQDQAALRRRMPGRYDREFAPLGADGLMSDCILPHPGYTAVCLQGAALWGTEFLAAFGAQTYLADEVRTLAQYLGEDGVSAYLNEDVQALIQRR